MQVRTIICMLCFANIIYVVSYCMVASPNIIGSTAKNIHVQTTHGSAPVFAEVCVEATSLHMHRANSVLF